jgi:hypothetical protein
MHRTCLKCQGTGKITYNTKGTWKYDGEEAKTEGVCDRCWGSGNVFDIWTSPAELEKIKSELKETQIGYSCMVHELSDVLTDGEAETADELLEAATNIAYDVCDIPDTLTEE